MKSVLVMDMPECCYMVQHGLGKCTSSKFECFLEPLKRLQNPERDKEDWCPLKEINPNMIKALRCFASQDGYGGCYTTEYNKNRGDKPEMTCKGILDTIECPYHQEEYDTTCSEGMCRDWLNELADMLEGKC